MVNVFQSSTFFAKSSNLDVWLSSGCVSLIFSEKRWFIVTNNKESLLKISSVRLFSPLARFCSLYNFLRIIVIPCNLSFHSTVNSSFFVVPYYLNECKYFLLISTRLRSYLHFTKNSSYLLLCFQLWIRDMHLFLLS